MITGDMNWALILWGHYSKHFNSWISRTAPEVCVLLRKVLFSRYSWGNQGRWQHSSRWISTWARTVWLQGASPPLRQAVSAAASVTWCVFYECQPRCFLPGRTRHGCLIGHVQSHGTLESTVVGICCHYLLNFSMPLKWEDATENE